MAIQTGEFMRDVTTSRGEDGSNFNNHSQGNILTYSGLNYINSLGDYDNGGFKDTDYFGVSGQPTLAGFGSPMNTTDMDTTSTNAGFIWNASYAHDGDPVANILGNNAGLDNEFFGNPDTSLSSLSMESHSNYYCDESGLKEKKIVCGNR